MNIKIFYSNKLRETDRTIKLVYLVKKAVKASLEYMNFPYDCEVSLTFCGDEFIRELNCKYRKKDSATDVLSFPLNDFSSGDEPDEELNELGDIVINIERAAVQAEEYGHSLEREVAFLAIHSTLHLLGLDHERSEEEDEFVCSLQDEIIKEVFSEKDGDNRQ
ncbi:MAG: rRNA maturation RNase YbeY [Clostridia bacterium]|nr:rRNA maturation RNase YbeY [Clostridia bacterium]